MTDIDSKYGKWYMDYSDTSTYDEGMKDSFTAGYTQSRIDTLNDIKDWIRFNRRQSSKETLHVLPKYIDSELKLLEPDSISGDEPKASSEVKSLEGSE